MQPQDQAGQIPPNAQPGTPPSGVNHNLVQNALGAAASGFRSQIDRIFGDAVDHEPTLTGDALAAGEAIVEQLVPVPLRVYIVPVIGYADRPLQQLKNQLDAKAIAGLKFLQSRLDAIF
jgi:hypothetical protein